MKMGWIVGIATAYAVLLIFSIICDQAWFNGQTLATLSHLTQFHMGTSTIPIIGPIIGVIDAVKDFIDALAKIIFLKFDFWSGNYMILWYIFCLPVGIGVVVTITIEIVSGRSG
jgi:hypothetical protein